MTNGTTAPPTEETYQVVYTEAMLRRAVRLFVWRRALRRRGWLWLVAIALLGIGLASGWREAPTWVSAVQIAAILLVPVFFLLVWRAHFVNTVGKFRAMTSPVAKLFLPRGGDDDVFRARCDDIALGALHRRLGDTGILDDISDTEPVHHAASREPSGGDAGFSAFAIAAKFLSTDTAC